MHKPSFFNPVLILLLPVQSIQAGFLNHHKKRFLLVWSSPNYFPVHQPAATNFMHLQSTYTPHLHYSTSNQRRIWNPVEHLPWSFIAEIVNVFGVFNPLGLKLIWRLRLGLSHLNEHRFKHNFNDCMNPLCTCSLDIESTVHYFLHCNYYNSASISLLNDLNAVDRTLLSLSDLSLLNVLLYGGPQFDDSQNTYILNLSIKYILISERFSGRLF